MRGRNQKLRLTPREMELEKNRAMAKLEMAAKALPPGMQTVLDLKLILELKKAKREELNR